MKKLNLQLGSIREMLSKEQMKKIVGGAGYPCGYRCDDSEEGNSEGCKDCNRETIEALCDGDASKAVCVCG